MKRMLFIMLALCLALALASCGDDIGSTATTSAATTANQTHDDPNSYNSDHVIGKFSKFDLNTVFDDPATGISFSASSAAVTGNGAAVNGTTVTITAPGNYMVSGNCSNGQLIVEVTKLDQVHIMLDGLNLTCQSSAAIWIKSADKVVITLKPGTESVISDGTTLGSAVDAPNSTIYSKDDLTFNGSGKLTVQGNVNNGIGCSNDLKFTGGTYVVTATKNGIKGNDSIAVMGSTIIVNAGKDGMKASTIDDTTKGFVFIDSGTLNITTGDDGIQAVTAVDIRSGSLTFNCIGNTVNCDGVINRGTDVNITIN